MTVAVVDVEHGVLAVDYRVQDGPDASRGWLRFVGARDVRWSRWGLRRGLRRLALL